MLPNPLDFPPTEAPHTWCNWLTDRGELICTLHTRDDWAYSTWIYILSDGAHVNFFKREALGVMRCFGGYVEGLEHVEESFARWGIDIPGWAGWIQRYGVTARNDGGAYDHETEQNGVMIGGYPSPFYWYVEKFYADQRAKHAA